MTVVTVKRVLIFYWNLLERRRRYSCERGRRRRYSCRIINTYVICIPLDDSASAYNYPSVKSRIIIQREMGELQNCLPRDRESCIFGWVRGWVCHFYFQKRIIITPKNIYFSSRVKTFSKHFPNIFQPP